MPSPTPSPTRDATSTRRGLMGVAAQTFSGVKTFLDAIKLALKPTVDLPAGGAELEGHILYDSTLKRPQVHDGTGWKSVVVSTNGTDATSLEEHLTSTSAHAAASITYGVTNVGATLDTLHGTGGAATIGTTDSSEVTGSNVQAQIAYLGTSKVDWSTFASEAAAGGMGATPGGGLISTDVQGQLYELLAAINATQLTASSSWTDLTTSVKTSEGWSVPFPADPPRAIIIGNKVVFAGTVKRIAADWTKNIPIDLPLAFQTARVQVKIVQGTVPTLSPIYVPMLLSSGLSTDPHLYLHSEPNTSYANLSLKLDGYEYYLY